MKTPVWLLSLFLAASFSMGCAIVPLPTKYGSGSSALSSSGGKKQCKPSQYWDGGTCRHKGKGKGARKHDGR